MLTSETQIKLLSLFREILGPANMDCSESTELRSLEKWDSLSVLDFILGLEDHFGFQMDPARFAGCTTIGDVMRVVETGMIN